MNSETIPGVWVASEDEATAWWRRLALAGAVMSVVLGLVLMIWPDVTLTVVAVLVGVWLLLAGAVRLAQATFIPEGRRTSSRVLQAITGLLLVVLGVICMRDLSRSLVLIALIIGIAWLFGGVIEIFIAVSPLTHGWGRVGALLLGLLSIVGAFVVIFWPEPSLTVIAWLTGVWFLAMGLLQLGLAWSAGRSQH